MSMSQELGVSFPVYALFTKLDLLPHFPEFAHGLNEQEVSEILGATVPVRLATPGTYADQERERLTNAFDELFYSLAEKRLTLLARENQPAKLGGIYEFPREFRKLETLLVDFLVELGRPSHLSVNPFLRGFYFSGIRPIFSSDLAPAEHQIQTPELEAEGRATQYFEGAASSAAEPVAARASVPRKKTQWLFVTRVFSDVIARDRGAFATSSFSTTVNVYRRIGLTTLAVFAAILAIGFTASYLGNRALVSSVERAETTEYHMPATGQLPPPSDVQELAAAGELVEKLGEWSKSGAPMRLRWGLYVGDQLYRPACQAYARGLNQLILDPVRASLSAKLNAYSNAPGPSSVSGDLTGSYQTAYRELKTYLIITDQGTHAREDGGLAADVQVRYMLGRSVGDDFIRAELNRYALLLSENPKCFQVAGKGTAVAAARQYLLGFPPVQRMYQAMFAYAGSGQNDLVYNAVYPHDIISDDFHVPYAFQKGGWTRMKDALTRPGDFGGGEPWVLGGTGRSGADPYSLVGDVTATYRKQFIETWTNFIHEARFSGYHGPEGVREKLNHLAGSSSPLLRVLCVTAENTPPDDPVLRKALSAPNGVVPEKCESNLTGPVNAEYTEKLFAIPDCIDKMVRENVPDQRELERQTCSDRAAEVISVAGRLVARNEGEEPVNKAVTSLLESPVTDRYLAGVLKQPTPKGARDLCEALAGLSNQFPQNSSSLAELQHIFAPGGELDQYAPEEAGPAARSSESKIYRLLQQGERPTQSSLSRCGIAAAIYRHGAAACQWHRQ